MSKPSWLNNKIILLLIWVVAIAVRVYGATTPAQIYDIGTFEAWSRSFWVHGISNFFSTVWSDYLPLPILTFAPISLLADSLNANFGLTFKLVHIFIELVLIYFIARSKTSNLKPITYLLLLSPALIGDNAFWGQVDTVPALLALLSLTKLVTSRSSLLASSILFGLAVAYKPIMILIAPVLWIVSLKQGYKFYTLPIISGIVFLLSGVPTGGTDFFIHLWSRVMDQSGTYPYLTINAFNLWSLVPNPYWIKDSSSVLSLSGKALGLSLFAISTIKILNDWRLEKWNVHYSYRVAATVLITFFTFTTRMHERHLLFGLPFLALATMYDKFLLLPYTILTLTFTLNLYGALYWVNYNQTWPFSQAIISLISWVTVIATTILVGVRSFSKFFTSLRNIIQKNIFLVGILILATLLRFTNLSHPPVYIFDEVYHAFTSREFLHNHVEAWEWWTTPPEGVAYEWTHPPVAKYGMVIGMLLFGENSLGWRIGSSTFGVLSILGIYLLVSSLTKNRQVALLSAFLISIEGLHIAQSRIAMNDIYMLNFYIWSLYLAVKSRWKLSAILYGLALGSKWSALYGIIPLGIIYLYSQNYKFNLISVLRYFVFAIRHSLIAIFVYVLAFAPFILAGHTWEQWWELHRQMWYYHTHLVATHGYQSVPMQWLFAVRPVWYWVDYGKGLISNIYAQSNPIILWLGLVALIMQIRKILSFPYSILYLLYTIFTLPWIFSPRIMFFYHYLPSSVFLCVILATWLVTLPKKYLRLAILLCAIGYILITPMLYGYPMSETFWNYFFKVIPTWK
ncbi:phospholipid carrier-dependent glycosyltransferase [Candidatus Woesebacteria bacterium]|nr:phospholipid carrier-dependent glycosyltransferase [Candidatus Woesebacteria bacterium]